MRSSSLALQLEAMPRQRGVRRMLRASRIVHPFPTLLNVAATAALAFIAARGVPESRQMATMLLFMLCAQSAIGVTNDLFDRDLDARTKPWKPLVAGFVSIRAGVVLAIGLTVASVTVAAMLGPAVCGLAVLGLACGLAYDVRLKRTMFSAVPYMVGIPVLPLWVWTVDGDWQPVMWWLLPLGAPHRSCVAPREHAAGSSTTMHRTACAASRTASAHVLRCWSRGRRSAVRSRSVRRSGRSRPTIGACTPRRRRSAQRASP